MGVQLQAIVAELELGLLPVVLLSAVKNPLIIDLIKIQKIIKCETTTSGAENVYGMCDARTLHFHRKMGGRSRCTFVVAKRFQGEYSGLIERLGSNLDGVLNSIRIAERNGACLPGAHGRQDNIFVFCSPLPRVHVCGRPTARNHPLDICN